MEGVEAVEPLLSAEGVAGAEAEAGAETLASPVRESLSCGEGVGSIDTVPVPQNVVLVEEDTDCVGDTVPPTLELGEAEGVGVRVRATTVGVELRVAFGDTEGL